MYIQQHQGPKESSKQEGTEARYEILGPKHVEYILVISKEILMPSPLPAHRPRLIQVLPQATFALLLQHKFKHILSFGEFIFNSKVLSGLRSCKANNVKKMKVAGRKCVSISGALQGCKPRPWLSLEARGCLSSLF